MYLNNLFKNFTKKYPQKMIITYPKGKIYIYFLFLPYWFFLKMTLLAWSIKHRQKSLKREEFKSVASPNDSELDGYVVESTMLLAMLSFYFGVITTIWFAKSSPSYSLRSLRVSPNGSLFIKDVKLYARMAHH